MTGVQTCALPIYLSQDEVAYLLGNHNGAEVCRHERFNRVPSLATALAYEALFQKPTRELFAGLFQEVELEVAERLRVLAVKLDRQNDPRGLAQKLWKMVESITLRTREVFNEQ